MNLYTNTSEVDMYKGLPITPHVKLAPIVDLGACFDQFKEGLVPSETGQIFPVNYKIEDQQAIQWKLT